MTDPMRVRLLNLRIPLDPPMASPRGPVTETYLLLVFMSDDDGQRGAGYASFRRASEMEQATGIAQKLLAEAVPGLPGLLAIERQQEASCEPSHPSRSAASALSLAAWDLAGKRAGVACADLWGRPAGRERLACYASALWLDKSLPELVAEANAHRANNYRSVKMRVSRDLEDNLARIGAVREVYSEPATIALETGSEWTAAIANDFLDACTAPLMWLEDPAPHAEIHLVEDHPFNSIAAGEKATVARELYDLYARGRVRNVIIDVQYVGGPVRFMEAARVLTALGATVGGHRFSHYSTHLLAALPRSLPIELLDWTNPAFRPLGHPDPDGCIPVEGPGFRIAFDETVIERYGVEVSAK
jgi:L-alanine-DL-glutamate epimerase-like enolase superfamily enzyme